LWPVAHEDELGEIEAGEAMEAGTEPGPLAEAVRRGHGRAERALARHRDSREELETQEGFDAAAHEEAARRLVAAVEERTRLPVRFGTPPAPANDLPPPPALAKAGDDPPPPPALAKAGDDPPEETYEYCPWAGDGGFGDDGRADGTIDDDRADGAEHDWLYQRRNGYDEIYDPWAPEEVEERRRTRLEQDEGRGGEDDPDWDDDEDRDDDDGEDEFAPGHDIA
ncbi:MAG: hypothetical protein OXG99_10265, partial [Alphaproteobacteria bacterium]|nr:hypothetical protein [Alphaproteobacteria bacterium]